VSARWCDILSSKSLSGGWNIHDIVWSKKVICPLISNFPINISQNSKNRVFCVVLLKNQEKTT
jgi:hypothetical protein